MIQVIPGDDEILSIFEGFNLFRVRAEIPTLMYVVGEGKLEDLRSFAESMSICTVFVESEPVDPSELRISDELLDGVPQEIRPGVQLDAHRFNRELDGMDLSSPAELRIFVLYEGKAFGSVFVDPELDAFRKFSARERVEEFVRARSQKVQGSRVMEGLSTQKEDPGVERFVELLIKDPEYRRMPDDNERFNYVLKIARRPGNDTLREGIMKDGGKGFSTEKIRRIVSLSVKRMDLSRSEPKQMVFGRN